MSDRDDEDEGAAAGDGGVSTRGDGSSVRDAGPDTVDVDATARPAGGTATAPPGDRAAASAGVAVAAVAIVAAALPGPAGWEPVAAALGGAAAVAFGLRRWGVVDRTPGALLAGAASVAVGGYALARLVTASLEAGALGPEPMTLAGPWLATGAAVAGVAAAYADLAAIPAAGLVARLRATVVGLLIGGAGVVGIVAWGLVLLLVVGVLTGDVGDVATTAVGALGLGLGTGSVGLLYLAATDRPLSYIDFRAPGLRDLAFVLGGILALLGALFALTILFSLLGTTPSEHSVVQQAEQNPAILLVLIPAAWLIIGPGEELLFRNVVQKSLHDTFSRPGAVVVASGIFAAAHFNAYFSPNPVSLLQSLLIVFVLSLLLGALYELTENTTVPALVHGTYNAVLFILLYLNLGGAAGDGSAAAVLVAALP